MALGFRIELEFGNVGSNISEMLEMLVPETGTAN